MSLIVSKVASNAGAGLLNRAVLTLQHIVTVPLFIEAWGVAIYGEWLTVYSVCMALNLFNCGVGTAATNSYTIKITKGHYADAVKVYRAGFSVITALILLGVLIGSCSLSLINSDTAEAFFHVPLNEMLTASFLLGLSALLTFYLQLNEGWFRVVRQVHKEVNLRTVFLSLKILGMAGLLLADFGMVVLAAWELTLMFLTVITQYLYAKKLTRGVPLEYASFTTNEVISLLKKGGSYLMIPLRGIIQSQGVIVITRLVIGAEAVALIGSLRILSNLAVQLYNVVSTSMLPELQRILAVNDKDKSKDLFSVGTVLCAIIGTVCTGFMAVSGTWIYGIWTSGSIVPTDLSWILVLCSALLKSLWCVPCVVFIAVDKPKYLALIGLGLSVLGLICSFIFSSLIGFEGVLIGGVIFDLTMVLTILPGATNFLGMRVCEIPVRAHTLLLMQIKSFKRSEKS